MNYPKTESGVRSILKDMSDVPWVLRIEGSGTLRALIIYQDFSAVIFNVIPLYNF